MTLALYPYQRTGAHWLSAQNTALLADEPGLGKTSQSITAADEVQARKILVICPGIAKENWAREWKMWSAYRRRIQIITTSKRINVTNPEVVIVSYTLINSRPVLLQLLKHEWDVLICDESHFLKNREAVRTKVVFGAKCDRTKGLASVSKRVWLLSGTPFPNNLSEAWPMVRALFPDVAEGYERYSAWVDKFCVMDSMGVRIVSNKNLQEFVSRFKPHVLRRKVTDVLTDLPPIRFTEVVVKPEHLPPKSKEELDAEAVVKAAIAERMQKDGREADLTEDDLKAIQYQMGMHLASIRRWTGYAKAHAVAQIIKDDLESGLDKVVIFAIHRSVFDILLKEIPGSKAIHGGVPQHKRDQIIDEFQGKVPGTNLRVIVVHLDIAATAITLTASCNVVFAEISWTPMHIQQAAKRCHRIGQSRPVLARIISLEGTIDEAVSSVVARKANSINKIEFGLTTPV